MLQACLKSNQEPKAITILKSIAQRMPSSADGPELIRMAWRSLLGDSMSRLLSFNFVVDIQCRLAAIVLSSPVANGAVKILGSKLKNE